MTVRKQAREPVEEDRDEWDEDETLVEPVSPAQARRMLAAAGADLVGIDWDRVDRLSKRMSRRSWDRDRNPVRFSAGRDRIIQGREVLLAVIESGEEVELLVCELDAEDEADARSSFIERGVDPRTIPLLLDSLTLLSRHRSSADSGESAEPASEAELLRLLDAESSLLRSLRWVVEEVGDLHRFAYETLVVARHLAADISEELAATFFPPLLFEEVTPSTPKALRRFRKGLRKEAKRAERRGGRKCHLTELRLLLQAWDEWNRELSASQSRVSA